MSENVKKESQDVILRNELGRRRAYVRVESGGSELVALEAGAWDYKTLVTALVRSKYSEDDMEAIVNNNLALLSSPSGVSDEEGRNVASEFEEMQQWRKACKARAKELLAIGEEMGLRMTE